VPLLAENCKSRARGNPGEIQDRAIRVILMKRFMTGFVVFIAAALLLAGCSNAGYTVASQSKSQSQFKIVMSEQCGCCGLYSKYMKKHFDVAVTSVDDISQVKDEYGVPDQMRSCHTGIIDGYFVEGHVPYEAVEKLIAEKPEIAGIALPGMPSGAPGMPGSKREPFVVYAIHKDGSTTEFMRI